MTAALTHDGNPRNASSASRLASSILASRYRCEPVAFCWIVQSPIRIVGESEASRPTSAVARRPPALADPKGGASQLVAEQFKPDEKVARVDWRRVGVGGYRFEPGNDA